MKNPASVMSQHQEYVQDLEAKRRHREEIHRYQALQVILQEGPPRLRWRPPGTDYVLADASLANVDAEFEQLSMNPRRSPGWVLSAYLADQIAYVLRACGPPRLATSDLPGPKKAKTFPMPGNHRLGLDEENGRAPVGPDSA